MWLDKYYSLTIPPRRSHTAMICISSHSCPLLTLFEGYSRDGKDAPPLFPLIPNCLSSSACYTDFSAASLPPPSQSFAASYVPRYSPLPTAVHVDRKPPPRNRPLVPLSRYICFATRQGRCSATARLVLPFADALEFSPPSVRSIIRVLTTSLGVVMNAAMAPALAALAPAMAPVSRIRW